MTENKVDTIDLDTLDETARQLQDDLYAQFKWIYHKIRYILAIVFSGLISGVISYLANDSNTQLVYRAIGFGILLVMLLVVRAAERLSGKQFDALSMILQYLMGLLIGAILGSLPGLAFASGTIQYIYFNVLVVVSGAFVLIIASTLWFHFSELRIIDADHRAAARRGRFKHPRLSYNQLDDDKRRPF